MTLLNTKFQPPLLRPGLVSRPQLLQTLRASSSTRATLICAPAGAGKTSLLAEWASDRDEHRTMGWLSLDAGDSDPTLFWRYFVEALRRIRPDMFGTSANFGAVTPDEAINSILPAIVNAFGEVDEEHVLVLDDLHLISTEEVYEGLEFLIDALPPSLHIALSTRMEPPLPIARWRARRELTELKTVDLYMDPEEGRSLLAAADTELDGATVAELIEQSEGWPAGLYLAALSFRGGRSGIGMGDLTGDTGELGRFLLPEVLDRMTDDDRTFLLQTSVLTRLSPGICDALLERDDSALVLARIARTNLFLVPLDHRQREYRYHHLFRELLRSRLDLVDPGAASDLHLRASRWELDSGDPVEAIRHLNSAGRGEAAGELLVKALIEELAPSGRLGTFKNLLQDLPVNVVEADPRLLITAAWSEWCSGRYDQLGVTLDLLESKHDPGQVQMDTAASFEGSLRALRAMWLFRSQDAYERALALARELPSLEPDPALPSFWFVRSCLAELEVLGGKPESVLEWMDRELSEVSEITDNEISRFVLAAWLALAWCEFGDQNEGASREEAFDRAWSLARKVEYSPDFMAPEDFISRLVLGRVALARGQAGAAERELRAAIALPRYWTNPDLIIQATVYLAIAVHNRGDDDEAVELLREASELATNEPVGPAARALVDRSRTLLRRKANRRLDTEELENLSQRELQILRLLSGSLTQREIGDEIFLSFNTVKGYSKSLYRKLGVSSRQEAVERGRELGLI